METMRRREIRRNILGWHEQRSEFRRINSAFIFSEEKVSELVLGGVFRCSTSKFILKSLFEECGLFNKRFWYVKFWIT